MTLAYIAQTSSHVPNIPSRSKGHVGQSRAYTSPLAAVSKFGEVWILNAGHDRWSIIAC